MAIRPLYDPSKPRPAAPPASGAGAIPVGGAPAAPAGPVRPPPLAAPAAAEPAPAAPAAPVALTPADIDAQARTQVDTDTAAGKAWAASVLPDGTLSRLGGDADVKDYLGSLKARTSGMTPEELRAQYEQGTSSSDAELATNLRRMGQISGNAGVRGGAAAGMQAGALNHSIDQQAALQRQMILDNIAQKNGAFAAYGSNMMGVKQYDGGQTDKEKMGQLSLAEQKGGQFDSARTGIKADIAAADGVSLAKEFLKSTGAGGTGTEKGGFKTATDTYDTSDPNSFGGTWLSASNGAVSRNGTNLTAEEALEDPTIKWKMSKGLKPNDPVPEALKSEFVEALKESMKQGYGGVMSNGDGTGAAGKPGDSATKTIICTEAMRQSAFDQALYPTAASSSQVLGYSTMRAYHAWGGYVVAAMRTSPALTKAIAWFLPDTVAAIHGKPHRLRGAIGHAIFRTLNTLVKLARRSILRAA